MRYPETKEELELVLRAWQAEQSRLYQSFNLSLNQEQRELLLELEQAAKMSERARHRLRMYDKPLKIHAQQQPRLAWPKK